MDDKDVLRADLESLRLENARYRDHRVELRNMLESVVNHLSNGNPVYPGGSLQKEIESVLRGTEWWPRSMRLK